MRQFLMGECAFCQIVSGEVDAAIVLDDSDFVAFLDHRPLFAGHCLLIPKRHIETLREVPGELIGPLFERVQALSNAVETGMAAQGTFVAINNRVSQSVPHLHIHIVPRTKGDGLKGFFWPRRKYAPEEMLAAQRRIRDALTLA